MTRSKTKPGFDAALNMARQSLYRFAALSLVDPRTGCWEQLRRLSDDRLVSDAAALVRSWPGAMPARLGLGERPLGDLEPSAVLARLPASHRELNEAYERTFGLLVANACPPYETEYIDSRFAFQRSNTLADVSGFYRAFGLAPSELHPERPDHIVQELEFMAFVIGLERGAAAGDRELRRDRVEVCRTAQTRFLREHLASWATAFARLLAREDQDGFYGAAGVFLAALIPAERGLLGIDPPPQSASPSPLERPEACEACGLHSVV
jgi:TorA maturation chaperone TorD